MPTDPVRIAIVHWGSSGAGPRLTRELADALGAVPEAEIVLSYRAGTEQSSHLARIGVPTQEVRTYASTLGVLNLPRWVRNVVQFRRLLRRHRVQVVISPMFSLWQSLALPLLVPRRVRYVSTIHDATEHPGDEHVLKRMAQRRELRRADAVMTFSRTVARALGDRGTDARVTVHPAFRSSGADRVTRPVDHPLVLGFFGRLVAYKGLDLFVDMIRTLTARGVDVVGQVHGDGEVGAIESSAADLPIEWHVGWVDEDDTNAVVAGYDVLVLPYREASQSGVFALALAEGVPVVATPVGGLTEQVDATGAGIVATAVSAEALADAVTGLARDRDRLSRLSEQAVRSAGGDHSWARVATDYLQVARELTD